jgi:hypothetical protein
MLPGRQRNFSAIGHGPVAHIQAGNRYFGSANAIT